MGRGRAIKIPNIVSLENTWNSFIIIKRYKANRKFMKSETTVKSLLNRNRKSHTLNIPIPILISILLYPVMHISSSTPAYFLSSRSISLSLSLFICTKRSLLLPDNSFLFHVVWGNQQISLAAASTAALAMR